MTQAIKSLLPFFIFFLVVAGLSIQYPPVVAMDEMEGLLTWQSFEQGSKFNYTRKVDPSDIAGNTEKFITWWTPGQYFFPGIFKSIFGLNWGMSLVISAFFAVCIFLTGYYLLLKRLEFEQWVVYASMVVAALQVHIFHPFILFAGGDIFYNAFIPWSLLLLVILKPLRWYYYPVFFFIGILGFFIKSSFFTLFAAFPFISLALLHIRSEGKSNRQLFKNVALWGITFSLTVFVVYHFFISKGDNPAVLTKSGDFYWINLFFPLASPLTSAFSIDLLIDLFYDFPMHVDYLGIKVVPSLWSFYGVLAAVMLLSVIWILTDWKINAEYKILLGVIFIVMSTIYSYFYMNDAKGVGMESRHYYVLGVLFIPGIISRTMSGRKWLTYLLFAFMAVQVFSGFYLMGNYKLRSIKEGIKGESGITLVGINQSALNKIHEIDESSNSNSIIHLPSYEWLLEVQKARANTAMEIWMGKAQISGYVSYRGCADELYVFGAAGMSDDGRLQAILSNYKDYEHFDKIWEDENTVIMKGACKTVAIQ